jgi:chemotaxis protein MotA
VSATGQSVRQGVGRQGAAGANAAAPTARSGLDVLSIAGLALGVVAILGGSILKGSGLAALWNGAAFVIVILGTLAATLLQVRLETFKHSMKMFRWIIQPPTNDPAQAISKIVTWSQVARKDGLLGLESTAEEEPDEFLQKGLQLLVDGSEPEALRGILEVDISTREEFDTRGAKVFESMGIYAPTLGIIGAVLGLIAVMGNLADPSKLGPGIATAFTATIYGIASANMFFLPVANKLKTAVAAGTTYREMLVEGMVSIAQGENPRNIETKLNGYLSGG